MKQFLSGDGQESAFYYSDSVMTVSCKFDLTSINLYVSHMNLVHLFEPGFFPGKTGGK